MAPGPETAPVVEFPRHEGRRSGLKQWRSAGCRLGGSEMRKAVQGTWLERSRGFMEANVGLHVED